MRKKKLNPEQDQTRELSVETYLKNPDPDYQMYRVMPHFNEQLTEIDPYLFGRGVASIQAEKPGIPVLYRCNSKRIRLRGLLWYH